MADAVPAASRIARHASARSRRRRDDLWIATTALTAALLALPLARSSAHAPEVASVLAVSAVALLAGQRWAIALIVLAELLLAPTVAARSLLGGVDLWPERVAALGSMLALVPGMFALRRAAAALVLITGRPRTRATCRRFHGALVAVAVVAAVATLI
ncbi:MAG TPA: hypothetical protein VLX92_32760 [Kofleriaceae bacterium]|nr:hypothetical protein [Kofleriaceae bacterium]